MTHTELIPIEAEAVVVTPVVTVSQALEQLKEMREFRAQVLSEGSDYGRIGGMSKPTLLKPGAEKLLNIFGLSVQHELMEKVEDWEKPFFAYTVRAVVRTRRGDVVADCFASCNSRERKYVKQDAYSIVNTLQKMAQKRAMIGAVLIATRASEEYTQDVEDGQPADEAPATAELTKASDAEQKTVFEDAFRARITRETFPEFYQSVVGRKWDGTLYAEDVKALLAECGKRIAAKGKAGKPVAEGSAA